MKERFVTLAAALGTVLFVIVLMLPSTPRQEKPVSVPTTVDRGEYGLAALYNWLVRRKVPVYTLRERYDVLVTDAALPETGNLLVVSVPQRLLMRHTEREALRTWVRQGNHVLLLAAFSDWPDWAHGGERVFADIFRLMELSILTGRFKQSDGDEDPDAGDHEPQPGAATPETDKAPEPAEEPAPADLPPVETSLVPPVPFHPLMDGIARISVERQPGHDEWWRFAGRPYPRRTLVLLRDEQNGAPALWQVREGEGSIIISRHAGVFNNARLGREDNARLFLNLANYLTRGDGRVIFDDAHQGLTRLYDPDAFWGDSRLHHTLLFLLALWIIYIIGHSNRLLVIRRRNAMLRLVSHVEAVGGFFARRLTRAAAARRLLHHFFNQLRHRLGMPQNGKPVWEFIDRQANIDPADAASLREYHARAMAGKRINLIKLHNLIYRLREAMS